MEVESVETEGGKEGRSQELPLTNLKLLRDLVHVASAKRQDTLGPLVLNGDASKWRVIKVSDFKYGVRFDLFSDSIPRSP